MVRNRFEQRKRPAIPPSDELAHQVGEFQQQLADSQQAVSRYQAEAQTLQAMV